jgi:hypothetical protein
METIRRPLAGLAFLALSAAAPGALAHCQVPCGIYDDEARIAAMREDVKTIGKAVTEITKLAGAHDAQAFNQAARWVSTKEEHASRIITTVAEYFLTQKVKLPGEGTKDAAERYAEVLADHHAVLRAAMKTKQTVDPAAVDQLEAALDAMAAHFVSAKEPMPARPR